MFCDEPIINSYLGYPEFDDDSDDDYFFDCYSSPVLSFHTMKPYRIILETEHFYISLESDGVTKSGKTGGIETIQRPGEGIEPYIHEPFYDDEDPWVDYEHTLFDGEKLLDVKTHDDHYELVFDDFHLNVFSYESSENVPYLDHFSAYWAFHHVYGCERYLKKPCSCGGQGELIMDFTSDYEVRCNKCKRSPWAAMTVIEAIEAWNTEELEADLSDIDLK